jgi:hypothetical protein
MLLCAKRGVCEGVGEVGGFEPVYVGRGDHGLQKTVYSVLYTQNRPW